MKRAGFTYKGKKIRISYDDFLYDLTHDFTATQPNLTDHETRQGLQFLKIINMPTSNIRSRKLCERYVEMRRQNSSGSDTSTNITTPPTSRGALSRSRIPVHSQTEPGRHMPAIPGRMRDRTYLNQRQLDRQLTSLLWS